MYFNSNFTYAGSWDVYGGDSSTPECDGASGTAFFYHNGTNIKYKMYISKHICVKIEAPTLIILISDFKLELA